MCASSGPRGEGALFAVRCGSVGAGAWGPVLPLPPALSPRARAGLHTHGLSARGAKDGGAVADRVTPGGAVCVGGVPRVAGGGVGCAGLSATHGCCAAPPWWLCVACGRARACARVVGGVCLAIARRHVSVVVIIRTREALQIREWVNPGVDTNGRRGESAVVRCGCSSAVCWGPTRMLVCIVGRLCLVRFRAKERVGPKDAVPPPWSGGRTVDILYISVVDGPECCEVDRFVVFAHGRA